MPPRCALSSLPIRLRPQGRIKLRSGRSPSAYWVNRCSYCTGPPMGSLDLPRPDRPRRCAMGYNARNDEIRAGVGSTTRCAGEASVLTSCRPMNDLRMNIRTRAFMARRHCRRVRHDRIRSFYFALDQMAATAGRKSQTIGRLQHSPHVKSLCLKGCLGHERHKLPAA